MIGNCHSEIKKIRKGTRFTLALVGNPNVGKSTVFNSLTGLSVTTANYPGKTVEINTGTSEYKDILFGVIDLPGTYSLGSISDDQFVARQEILEGKADVIVVIVDATNLKRNLYMVLQLIDLGYPVVVGCNLMDLAIKQNICIDIRRLSGYLGIPVIPIIATTGEGIGNLIDSSIHLITGSKKRIPLFPKYGSEMMKYINKLMSVISNNINKIPYGLSSRALSILLLEEDKQFISTIEAGINGQVIIRKAKEIFEKIQRKHGEKPSIRLSRERYNFLSILTDKVVQHGGCKISFSTKLWKITLNPTTGLPVLIGGLISTFVILYFFGGFLSTRFDNFWVSLISPYIKLIIFSTIGHNQIANTLLWGFDAGIQAALSVGIPYILTFYIILAFLEDTGYLNSIAFLTDSLMHKIGLHGRSVIPIIAGAGCNVPAIIGTRVLTTRREKVIACTLITLVPCSARTAIIMGSVAFFLGWQWALGIYLIDFIIGMLVGRSLALYLPGKSPGLVMEMFPFRVPHLVTIVKKTWLRFKEFIFTAIPIIAIGSFILGGLYESKLMWMITDPMSLIVEKWLGLPAIAGICLLFGILRKELALQLLIALAIMQNGTNVQNLLSFMNKEQIFVFALVTTLYIPCLATISALIKELGWKTAIAISLSTITIAVLVGGIAHQVLRTIVFLP